MDSLCDELSRHEYEDIVEVDYSFNTVNVKGRLKDHIQFWMNIQAPKFILSIISDGYKLPLLHTPPRSFNKNKLSAINNSVFVTESILDLLASDRKAVYTAEKSGTDVSKKWDAPHIFARVNYPYHVLGDAYGSTHVFSGFGAIDVYGPKTRKTRVRTGFLILTSV